MLADISSGNVDTADVLYLVAFIVFLIAAVAAWRPVREVPLATILGYVGLALLSLAFLVL